MFHTLETTPANPSLPIASLPLPAPSLDALGEPMIEPDLVRKLRHLHSLGWGAKSIAKELGIARNTVRDYLRGRVPADQPRALPGRTWTSEARRLTGHLFDDKAQGNAAVVRDLLAEQGTEISLRTIQRAVRPRRLARRYEQLASVRFETLPGQQMQIDFGEKWVVIAERRVRVYLMTVVLSFSRRISVRAFLSQRQDDRREGIVSALRRFGGLPDVVLCDNAGPLVKEHRGDHVIFHPGFAAFCKDWGMQPRACRPYRARTKGKVEAGMKYVKKNALAGRDFDSFEHLQAHLDRWCEQVDEREHGTTHERPSARFEREKTVLRPLPSVALKVRERRLRRKVANDCLVNVDTVRYSVPHERVGESVEVLVGEHTVEIFSGAKLVTEHHRSLEPHATIREAKHYEGLWRPSPRPSSSSTAPSELTKMGRSLQDYEDAIGGGS